MKKLLIIPLLLWAFISHATNYYASAAGSGSGCTIGSPCTLTTALTHGVGGDNILLNKGDTFSGTFTYSNSGNSGNPIIITSYGNGVNPIIDGGGSTTANSFNITGAFVSVSNITVQNNAWSSHGVFGVTNTHDVSITNCYINNGYRGFHLANCTNNITVTNCYVTNISHTGTAAGPAGGDGSMMEIDNCNGSGIAITGCLFWTQTPSAGVGDIISYFESAGTSGSPITVTGCYILGGSQGTNGYCGIGMGDQTGNWETASSNFISTSGFAGIQIAGGSNIVANSNKIYSPQNVFPGGTTGSIDGIGIFQAGSNPIPTNLTVGNNNINWTNYQGSIVNTFLQSGHGIATPTNWSTNTANGTADPAAPSTIVPNPLWTGSPWNSPIIIYGSSAFTFTVLGSVSQSPTNTGTASTNWTVSPSLPAGLSMSATTGVISGTPAIAQALINYTVSATNANGTGTYNFSITITGTSLIQVTGRKIVQL